MSGDTPFYAKDGIIANGAFYANSTQIIIPNTATLTANGTIGGAGYLLTSNGSGVYWATPGTLATNVSAQYAWTNTQSFTNTITFGNSSVNSTVNSTAFTGSANNSTYFNGQLASYYATTASLGSYQTTAGLSANVALLTSNNSTYFNGQLASYYANVSSLSSYQTIAGLSSNVATLTSNNSTYFNGQLASYYATAASLSSYQTTAGLSSNVTTLTSNNAYYLGGTIASSYQLNATLNANIASYLPTYNAVVNASAFTGSNFAANSSGIFDSLGNLRFIGVEAKSSAYQLANSDVGQLISITTGGITVNGSVLVPNSVFSIYNNSSANQTITQGTGATMQLAGTSGVANTGNRTLTGYGVATIIMIASNSFIISGAGLT